MTSKIFALSLLGCAAALQAANPSPSAPNAATAPAPSQALAHNRHAAVVLNFALLDHHGRMHELRRTPGKAAVFFFTANDCPIAKLSAAKLVDLRDRFASRGVQIYLVNSNPADQRREIIAAAHRLGIFHLPILKDDSQGVARHLGIRRTGETVAISTKDWSVFYHGAIDDQLVEGAQKPQPTAKYLETALEEFIAGKPVAEPRTVARGCVIQFDGGDGPDSKPVSYSKEIAPLLLEKCVHCHSPGNIGSGAMTSHAKIKGMAAMIEEVILDRRMPPWDADPHFGKFTNDPSLSLAQKQTLLRWIHQGAARGDGPDPLAQAQTAPAPDWPLGPPDLIARMPAPESIPATGVIPYRHIEVIATNQTDTWIRGVWVRPGNREVVHHLIARIKEGGHKDHLGENEMFVGWAPGTTQGWFPADSGKFLPKNARFDFEMHYTPNGSPQTDLTEVGFYFHKTPPSHRFESVPVVNSSFEIKPGNPDSHTSATYGFSKPAVLHSLTPHMHLRGKWMKFEMLFPNGRRETVCSVPRYDFNWQLTYLLEKPKPIPAGTWVMLSGGYDNSSANPSNPDPTRHVTWGDQSFDEMFLGWYNVTWPIDPQAHASK